MRFDETANGSEVRLNVGEELEIVLAETPSTSWRIGPEERASVAEGPPTTSARVGRLWSSSPSVC